MKCITAYDVKATFQETGRLPLQQCIALRAALETEEKSCQRNAVQDHSITTQVPDRKYAAAVRSSHPSLSPQTRTAQSYDNDVEYRLVVVGGDGSGKSRTVQTLLNLQGHSTARQHGGAESGGLYCGLFLGHSVQILDTSEWFRASKEHSTNIAAMMATDLLQLHPGPDAVLYTIDISNRFTKEHITLHALLDAIFNNQLHDLLIILFTHSDTLRGTNKGLEELVTTAPAKLEQILQECHQRYLLWDNADPKQNEPEELLRLLKEVKDHNLSKPCRVVPENQVEAAKAIAKRLSDAEEALLESSTLVLAHRQQQEKHDKCIKRSSKFLEKKTGQRRKEHKELQQKVQDLERSVEQSHLRQQGAEKTGHSPAAVAVDKSVYGRRS